MVTARSKFQLIRTDTETFLPGLSPESFDFIYIDGDHKFDKILSDIKNAKRLHCCPVN
jgi:Methyltransferase domain